MMQLVDSLVDSLIWSFFFHGLGASKMKIMKHLKKD